LIARRSDLAFRQMLEHAREVRDLCAGRTRKDLDEDRLLNLAIVRLLEIIGEAAARVSDEARATHAEIPWREVVGLRNRLIHGYDEVDFDVLWSIIEKDLPPFVAALEPIVAALPPD
jgi:uncharacterized protein with HEPN domain